MPSLAFKKIIRLSLVLTLCFAANVAKAQDSTNNVVDILPAKSVSDKTLLNEDGEDTHPPIRLTPDKSELIRLDKEAGTIIIGNPDHLSVLADSAKTLVLVPRMPGATYITVLDRQGEVLMQRHAIVAAPKEKYIRIRRSCTNSDDKNCHETRVYYCPDMCHEVNVVSEGSQGNNSPFDGLEKMVESGSASSEEAGSSETE